jgi:hypothetical protein
MPNNPASRRGNEDPAREGQTSPTGLGLGEIVARWGRSLLGARRDPRALSTDQWSNWSGAGGSTSNVEWSRRSSTCGDGRAVEPRSLGREPQTLKDRGDTGSGGDGSDDRHAAGATSVCKNVVQEHPPDERGPGEPSRPPPRLGPGWGRALGRRGRPIRRRWHDLGSRPERWSQHTMVAGQVDAWSGALSP